MITSPGVRRKVIYNGGKTTFEWINYKWCNGNINAMTKYCSNSGLGYEGFTDDLTELELADDTAYVNWGPAWRMPSIEQFQELINSSNTTTEWTMLNGVSGRIITSKKNGNSIFLPAAGFRNYDSLSNDGSEGFYWTRSVESDTPSAKRLSFDSSRIVENNYFRSVGQSVRPVWLSK